MSDFKQLQQDILTQAKAHLADLAPALGNTFQQVLSQRLEAIGQLQDAFQEGFIDQETLQAEMEREEEVFRAELITRQIELNAAVQKAFNSAFDTLKKGLLPL